MAANFLTVATGDDLYFRQFAPALIQSCVIHNRRILINVINPSTQAKRLIDQIKQKTTVAEFSLQYAPEIHFLTSEKSRIFYSTNRFFVASQLLKDQSSPVLIVDIDSYYNQTIPKEMDELFDNDVGLYLRDPLPGTVGWENEGTHVAAGTVYINSTPAAQAFLHNTCVSITSMPHLWFTDQVSLFREYCISKRQAPAPTFVDLNSPAIPKFMDWEYVSDSIMWTGKGERKYKNVQYVERQRALQYDLIGDVIC